VEHDHLIQTAFVLETGICGALCTAIFATPDPDQYFERVNRRAESLQANPPEPVDAENARRWLATDPLIRRLLAEETAAYWRSEGVTAASPCTDCHRAATCPERVD